MQKHLRAPARHGEILISPEGSLTALVRSNEASLATGQLWGQSLAVIREAARSEVVLLAARWTRELVGTVSEPLHSQYWIIGGHQPELFHPGVWVKNAVVAGLASQLGGVGLNLTVDNDICSGSTVRVPTSPASEGITSLNWDVSQPQSPWEERPAPDLETYSRFGSTCREHLRAWGIEPLAAAQDWTTSPTRGIVDRLAQFRSRFEVSVGMQNLELKVSDLADSLCFRQFLAGALRGAEPLRRAYNSSLAEYRAINHIRSRSHPVPALDATQDGVEVPFWVWRAGESHRSRLFVQTIDSGKLRLHNGLREIGTVSANCEATSVTELHDLRSQGWKIRPRALTLTLFCRVYLGSVFVHGIGGAKYDELTDVLMQRWLGLSPPAIIVATATLRLFESFSRPDLQSEIRRLKDELRTMQWNPEYFAEEDSADAACAQLRAEKSALLTTRAMTRGVSLNRAQRNELRLHYAAVHTQIHSINAILRQRLAPREELTLRELRSHLASLPYQQSLRSREFASGLFPAEAIQTMFHNALQQMSES